MKSIFINKNSQVRSGWKIASTWLSFYFSTNLITAIIMTIYMFIMIFINKADHQYISNFLANLKTDGLKSDLMMFFNSIQCICMIFFVALFWKVYDKRPIRDIGFINIKKGYKDLLKGLAFGSISVILVFIILLTSKNISLQNSLLSPNFNSSLLTGLILFILVGINEEMFARGYCITVLKQTGNKWVVIIVSSIIFSLMHSLNPSMSFLSYLNLFLFAVLAAYMFIKSNNLWLSIGYHITWNYFEGNVFGFQVSGLATQSLYTLNTPAQNIITGGNFGPEGGLVVTFITLLGIVYIWKFYKPQALDLNDTIELKEPCMNNN
ncbi:CPBP family intramembrane glutamic endopeptidase [Clostridium sp.]|uniref:CPBP family intramembrane glutamic endopeptidase n=1 Tax=Clostridium sp. TaxID=1506 RepID=UPI00284FD3E0|nr:CPBP family intramembrane glutamic endopeptidase [Clostridium sp.]MDR3598748.1 CPBP family intramembrane metalloprotease [Clostridium sp.]